MPPVVTSKYVSGSTSSKKWLVLHFSFIPSRIIRRHETKHVSHFHKSSIWGSCSFKTNHTSEKVFICSKNSMIGYCLLFDEEDIRLSVLHQVNDFFSCND